MPTRRLLRVIYLYRAISAFYNFEINSIINEIFLMDINNITVHIISFFLIFPEIRNMNIDCYHIPISLFSVENSYKKDRNRIYK